MNKKNNEGLLSVDGYRQELEYYIELKSRRFEQVDFFIKNSSIDDLFFLSELLTKWLKLVTPGVTLCFSSEEIRILTFFIAHIEWNISLRSSNIRDLSNNPDFNFRLEE